jgi:hypothetical protein
MGAWIAQHRKLIVPALGSVITIATLVWGAGNPWVIAVTAVAVAAGVYRVPNESRPAPAAPALPSSAGGGGTRPVRIVTPAAGTEGGPVTGVRP